MAACEARLAPSVTPYKWQYVQLEPVRVCAGVLGKVLKNRCAPELGPA